VAHTIRFGSDGPLALRADCNRGRGTYAINPDHNLLFGPAALTRAMCPPGSLGVRFVAELTRTVTFFLREGDLFLGLSIDSGTLRFRRKGLV
jgi:para-nitrobenzyl esterase